MSFEYVNGEQRINNWCKQIPVCLLGTNGILSFIVSEHSAGLKASPLDRETKPMVREVVIKAALERFSLQLKWTRKSSRRVNDRTGEDHIYPKDSRILEFDFFFFSDVCFSSF